MKITNYRKKICLLMRLLPRVLPGVQTEEKIKSTG